jgi:hypothetical protein
VNVTERHSPRYVAVLAVAAALMLAAGWLLRPRDIPQSPPPVPSESELQELTRRAQRRSLESATAYFADLATSVRRSLGFVPSTGASAVVWDDSHVITGPTPFPDRPAALTVRTAAGEQGAEVTSSRRLPLSALEVALAPSALVARRAASVPQPGDWVIAVWQAHDGPAFAAANFRQIASTTCGMAKANELTASISLTPAMIGSGMFNMDRELLAVILPCGDHIAAIQSSSIDHMLTYLTALEERLLARYGILFTGLSPDERRYFSIADGLLVSEVWMGTRGEVAGFQPGDVVVAVDDHAVAGIDDLRPLAATSGAPFEVTVRRGSNTQNLKLDSNAGTPGESPANETDVGLVIESPATTFRIDAVLPGSRAARAGVRAGDVLRRINRLEPRTPAQVDRAVKNATAKPVLLEIERDRRRLAIVIAEGAAR